MGGHRRLTDGGLLRLSRGRPANSAEGLGGRPRQATTAPADGPGRRIAVIGGGLTGLTTAYRLAKQQPTSTSITLYEASDRLGGWIRTDSAQVDVGGVRGHIRLERGPRTLSSLHTSTWRFDDLALYHLCNDLGLSLVSPPDGSRYILDADQRLEALPTKAWEMMGSRLVRNCFGALPGYALRRLLTRRGSVPSSDLDVSSWLRTVTMSRAVADLASALMHGVYGGDVDRLSARQVLGPMYWRYHLERPARGHVVMPRSELAFLRAWGADARVREMAKRDKGALLHFGSAGLESLTGALERALSEKQNVTIRKGCAVQGLSFDQESSQVMVKTSPSSTSSPPATYDKVIATILPHQLARISSTPLPSLDSLQSVSVMTVNLWYPRARLNPPGFGYLIPRNAPNPELALGVFFDSDVDVVGADEATGTKLFVLLGGHHYDVVDAPSETRAVDQAKALVERHLGIARREACFVDARFAPHCIPQPLVGHEHRLALASHHIGTAFAGTLAVVGGSYSRVGALAAIRSGYDMAHRLSSRHGWLDTGIEPGLDLDSFVDVAEADIRTVRNLGR
ncbi:hypothetical protein XA68_15916 [Ophiocordyceps unilateralis]|uniref:Protoporphyrinogen oxidase n=1 Tax=Ophiocordyceps unilateralis TaxID=268505 RepID=A0A2A9PLZ5_OPHUN|nr:hypothetical protein XA68_15916 [Ophiocordyceps unilateralis]